MTEFFKITAIDLLKKAVVVEDDELGLTYTIYNPKGEWVSAEIHDEYSVKFNYTDQDPVIINFME